MITFFVPGVPASQGSKRYVGHGVMIESSKKLAPWRADVKAFAVTAMDGAAPFDGPLVVRLSFVFPRPKSLKRSVTQKTTAPDLDKLIRAAFDAMTGIVFADDVQVVRVEADKMFGTGAGMVATITRKG